MKAAKPSKRTRGRRRFKTEPSKNALPRSKCDTVKKRKLTEEQLKEARRRVLQRSAKDILYMGKIVPNRDNPRAVAKYLSAELFASPRRLGRGVRSLGRIIELRWNEPRFVARMLIALGEYLLEGKPPFDDLDFDIADIIAQRTGQSRRPTIPELIRELQKRRPTQSFDLDMIKKRVHRGLLKNIPRQYLFPDL
jgi:hypothetical protein